MENNLPIGYWPEGAPEYLSPEGWDFEKKLAEEKLREQLKAIYPVNTPTGSINS